MYEYIRSIGGAIILSALVDLLAPEGSFKKYCRLACGFVVVAVMLSPVTSGFSFGALSVQEPDLAAAEAQARARVLTEHRANLEAITEARFPGSRAYIEVDNDGNVTALTVSGAEDPASVMDYARDELDLEEGSVKINEDK